MLRSVVSAVTGRTAVRKAVTGGVGRRVALRFVAGETLEDALQVAGRLNADGFEVSLDHLGENTAEESHAVAATQVYVDALSALGSSSVRAEVSVKLTQLGLDLDAGLAFDNAQRVLAAAVAAGTTVTLDMEDHRYTDATIDMCLRLSGAHPGAVGLALQAALRRTPSDLRRVGAAGVRVRLCKGAYAEPRKIAFASRRRVARAFTELTDLLMASDAYPMIATHDEAMIVHARQAAERIGLGPDAFEFQMLYGVRRELQARLRDQGYRVRIYVPFGDEWYAYLTRRIAERPANIRFFAEALVRR